MLIKKRLFSMFMLIIIISSSFIATPVHAADTTAWKVLWLICPKVVASSVTMSDDDISAVKDVSRCFVDFIYESTGHALRVDVDIKISEYTVETLGMYENSYWIDPKDVQREIDKYAPNYIYDSILVTARLDGIETSDYWGLCAGESYSEVTNYAGYSFIKMLENWDLEYLKKSIDNPYPESIYVHEWIHQLEFLYNPFGFSLPALDEREKYGYTSEAESNSDYFVDYLNKNVLDYATNKNIGITADMWRIKPSEVYKKSFYPSNNETYVDVKPIINVKYDYPVDWYPYENYEKGYAFLSEYNDDGSYNKSIAVPIDDSCFSADKKTLTLDIYSLTGETLSPHTKYYFDLNYCLTPLLSVYKQPFYSSYFTTGYSDVSSTAWYANVVNTISANGITKDISGTQNFEPNKVLTRAECIVMLMRAFDISPKPGENFNDVGNEYYANYLAEAKRLGLTTGTGNNLFMPNQKISRQEMFTFTYNVLNKLNKLPAKVNYSSSFNMFSDAKSVDTWAQNAIDYLVKSEVIFGTSDNKLNPATLCTRAEMSQIIYNLCF